MRAASAILHTGDFVTEQALAELEELGPPVHAVRGNVDEPRLRARLPERLVIEAEGLRIGLVHDGGPRAGRHERLSGWFPGCGAVAYGHSHLPAIERARGTWILNPGSPTERRRAPERTMITIRGGIPELVSLSDP